MRFLYLLTILIFFQTQLYSQTSEIDDRFDYVDAHVNRISQHMVFQPKILVDSLTRPFTNNYDKVRALYVWIAKNIKYDLFAYNHHREDQQGVNDVLRNGKAICNGFAILFQDLCKRANIQSEIIEGYARSAGHEKTKKFKRANHAWNAVFIHGSWYLLDATWATGDPLNHLKRKGKIDLNTFFLMRPEEMIKTHLPVDPTWQLLDKKMTLIEFENFLPIEGSEDGINHYSPSDYDHVDAYGKDLIKYSRASQFNPENLILLERLSFAYIYKGISLTEQIPDFSYELLKERVVDLENDFYSYMDSAWMVVAPISKGKFQSTKFKIEDEINYQKGVFYFEIGAELYNKAIGYFGQDNTLHEVVSKSNSFFKVAEIQFDCVSATSIYQNDVKEFKELITAYRSQAIEAN